MSAAMQTTLSKATSTKKLEVLWAFAWAVLKSVRYCTCVKVFKRDCFLCFFLLIKFFSINSACKYINKHTIKDAVTIYSGLTQFACSRRV